MVYREYNIIYSQINKTMLFIDPFWTFFTSFFILILVVVIIVFIVIILLVVKFLNSNVNSKRSSWVKIETHKPTKEFTSSQQTVKESMQYCSYCGEKVSVQENFCHSCGAEIEKI
jgi:uncharacterized membrane protein